RSRRIIRLLERQRPGQRLQRLVRPGQHLQLLGRLEQHLQLPFRLLPGQQQRQRRGLLRQTRDHQSLRQSGEQQVLRREL
ncbi:MAG: hypothetical protein ACK524_01780, partial [Planctomyces sp.]